MTNETPSENSLEKAQQTKREEIKKFLLKENVSDEDAKKLLVERFDSIAPGRIVGIDPEQFAKNAVAPIVIDTEFVERRKAEEAQRIAKNKEKKTAKKKASEETGKSESDEKSDGGSTKIETPQDATTIEDVPKETVPAEEVGKVEVPKTSLIHPEHISLEEFKAEFNDRKFRERLLTLIRGRKELIKELIEKTNLKIGGIEKLESDGLIEGYRYFKNYQKSVESEIVKIHGTDVEDEIIIKRRHKDFLDFVEKTERLIQTLQEYIEPEPTANKEKNEPSMTEKGDIGSSEATKEEEMGIGQNADEFNTLKAMGVEKKDSGPVTGSVDTDVVVDTPDLPKQEPQVDGNQNVSNEEFLNQLVSENERGAGKTSRQIGREAGIHDVDDEVRDFNNREGDVPEGFKKKTGVEAEEEILLDDEVNEEYQAAKEQWQNARNQWKEIKLEYEAKLKEHEDTLARRNFIEKASFGDNLKDPELDALHVKYTESKKNYINALSQRLKVRQENRSAGKETDLTLENEKIKAAAAGRFVIDAVNKRIEIKKQAIAENRPELLKRGEKILTFLKTHKKKLRVALGVMVVAGTVLAAPAAGVAATIKVGTQATIGYSLRLLTGVAGGVAGGYAGNKIYDLAFTSGKRNAVESNQNVVRSGLEVDKLDELERSLFADTHTLMKSEQNKRRATVASALVGGALAGSYGADAIGELQQTGPAPKLEPSGRYTEAPSEVTAPRIDSDNSIVADSLEPSGRTDFSSEAVAPQLTPTEFEIPSEGVISPQTENTIVDPTESDAITGRNTIVDPSEGELGIPTSESQNTIVDPTESDAITGRNTIVDPSEGVFGQEQISPQPENTIVDPTEGGNSASTEVVSSSGHGMYEVKPNDNNMWNIIKAEYADVLETIPPEKHNAFIDGMLDKMEADQSLREAVGVESPKLNPIHPGDQFDLSKLDGLAKELAEQYSGDGSATTASVEVPQASNPVEVSSPVETQSPVVPKGPEVIETSDLSITADRSIEMTDYIKMIENKPLGGIFGNLFGGGDGVVGTFDKLRDIPITEIDKINSGSPEMLNQYLEGRGVTEDGWDKWVEEIRQNIGRHPLQGNETMEGYFNRVVEEKLLEESNRE